MNFVSCEPILSNRPNHNLSGLVRQTSSKEDESELRPPQGGHDNSAEISQIRALRGKQQRKARNQLVDAPRNHCFWPENPQCDKKIFIFAQFSPILTCVPLPTWLYSGAARVFSL